jgi:hypothetical protein
MDFFYTRYDFFAYQYSVLVLYPGTHNCRYRKPQYRVLYFSIPIHAVWVFDPLGMVFMSTVLIFSYTYDCSCMQFPRTRIIPGMKIFHTDLEFFYTKLLFEQDFFLYRFVQCSIRQNTSSWISLLLSQKHSMAT